MLLVERRKQMEDQEGTAFQQNIQARREANLIAAADEVGMDVSRRSDPGFADEVRRRWMEANKEAFASLNAYVEKHGLPLEKYRAF
ncbi:type II toxin-antitoxin system CcdA family antitoxin [Sphingobium sp.]|uniref:type II toxin-antitoxin system CcdA family antitoxin n=1 Tax=Sphingobium sp. TaxID=1912891 RepID=UPI0026075EFA|nr:type II toxin-antitoxin system CcdA family antitoxin [Sphingobium sp.]